MKKQKV